MVLTVNFKRIVYFGNSKNLVKSNNVPGRDQSNNYLKKYPLNHVEGRNIYWIIYTSLLSIAVLTNSAALFTFNLRIILVR